jgi:hypothetical protein
MPSRKPNERTTVKFDIPKDWIERKANEELACGADCTTGVPPTPREMWIAEVRRLLREKYQVNWETADITRYSEALAETFFDEDPSNPETPDHAIYEDFAAGL